MDAITFFNIALRLAIWFLLTTDFSIPNILIGIAIALLLPLPWGKKSSTVLKDWLRVFWEIIVAIPQAYVEAIQIMLLPHNYEKMVTETVKPGRSPGLVFLDIFLITFTPKTIVTKYQMDVTKYKPENSYKVHHVTWRKESGKN